MMYVEEEPDGRKIDYDRPTAKCSYRTNPASHRFFHPFIITYQCPVLVQMLFQMPRVACFASQQYA